MLALKCITWTSKKLTPACKPLNANSIKQITFDKVLQHILSFDPRDQFFWTKFSCKITEIWVDDKNGYVQWKAENIDSIKPFIIEHYKWDKWVKVYELKNIGSGSSGQYGCGIWQHKGENKVRISQADENCPAKTITWQADIKETRVAINKRVKKIKFSRPTMFEVYDQSGKLIDKGADKNITSGMYKLYYSNSIIDINL